MKEKKRGLLLFTLLGLIIACSAHNELTSDSSSCEELVFEASFGDAPDTKTSVQSDGSSVWWNAHEEINIFYGGSDGNKFTSTNDEPVSKASFTGTLSAFTGENEAGDAHSFWAVYPYDSNTTCDGNSIVVEIPANQVATKETFADKQWLSVAKNYGLALSFYAVGAGFRFSLTKSNITSVSFKGNNNEVLAGKARITMDSSNRPVVQEYIEPIRQVTLSSQGDWDYLKTGTLYYFTFFPNDFEKGFTVQFKTANGEGARVYNSAVNFKRTDVHRGREFDKDVNSYIKIQATDTITMTCSHKLKPSVTFSNANNQGIVTWSSSDPSVVEVDENGIISGKALGTAVITATLNGASVSCTVPVGIIYEDKKFQQYMLENFDANEDGILSKEEALEVKEIDCSYKIITSLKGLEYCSNLETLRCHHNSLGHLDVSAFPELRYLYCSFCDLESIDFGTIYKLRTIDINDNEIEEIDLSNMIYLENCLFYRNRLTHLDSIPSYSLQQLLIVGNQLSGSIDVSKSKQLKVVQIHGVTDGGNDNLESLYINEAYTENKRVFSPQYNMWTIYYNGGIYELRIQKNNGGGPSITHK